MNAPRGVDVPIASGERLYLFLPFGGGQVGA